MTMIRTISRRERIRLQKKLRRLEKKYDKLNPNASLMKERLEKATAAAMKKMES